MIKFTTPGGFNTTVTNNQIRLALRKLGKAGLKIERKADDWYSADYGHIIYFIGAEFELEVYIYITAKKCIHFDEDMTDLFIKYHGKINKLTFADINKYVIEQLNKELRIRLLNI